MFWDIGPPVLAAVAQGVTGFLGWRVAVHGVREQRKALYEWLFAVASLVGIVSVGIAAYRGTAISRDLDALKRGQQMTNSGIQEIKNTPPTVIVNTPRPAAPSTTASVREEKFESSYLEAVNGVATGRRINLVLGSPVSFNVFYVNDGPAEADQIKGMGKIYLVPDTSEKTEQQVISSFTQAVKAKKWDSIGTMYAGGHDSHWFTAKSDRPIAQDDLNKLANGTEILYFLTYESWSDPAGLHYLHRCERLQPPAFNPEVWQFCRAFNDHR